MYILVVVPGKVHIKEQRDVVCEREKQIFLYKNVLGNQKKDSSLNQWGFPYSSAGKDSACNAGDPGSIPGSGRSPGHKIGYPLQNSSASLLAHMVKIHLQCGRPRFNSWIGKIPRRRAWQLTSVFLSGESHGQGAWQATVRVVTKSWTQLSS